MNDLNIQNLINEFARIIKLFGKIHGTDNELYKSAFKFYKNGLADWHLHSSFYDEDEVSVKRKMEIADIILDFMNKMKKPNNLKESRTMKKSEIKSIIFESVEQLKEYIGKLRDEYKRAYNQRDAEAVVYYNELMNDGSVNETDVVDFNKVFKHGPDYAKWKQDHAKEIADKQHAFSKTSSVVSKTVPTVAEEGEEKPFSMEESAPPGFPKSLHDKLVSRYGKTPKAYSTMWEIHKAKNEGNQKVTEMWIAMEGKILPEVGATFATNCPAPEEKPELGEDRFEPKQKEDFVDGMYRELKNAERKKDAEKVVYYKQALKGPSVASSFDKSFRGSWAYEGWKEKYAKDIADQEKEFKRFAFMGETGNLFDPGMLESTNGNVVNDILKALIDRKNSLRPQEENLHHGLMAAIDVVRKMQQGSLREGIFSNGRGLLYSKEMFYIQNVLEFDVKVEYEFYRGTNQPDDPSEVVIKEILTEEEILDSTFHDIHEPSEIKLISAIRASVKSLYPNTKPGVLIPKGADFVQINKKMRNYLDTDIEKLQETLFEKMTKY